jgi:hypothetical protein
MPLQPQDIEKVILGGQTRLHQERTVEKSGKKAPVRNQS